MLTKTCVLIATYNEADNIEQLLSRLTGFDVVVVDDGSPDGTAAICKSFENVTVISRPGKSGIASAYIDGFRWLLERKKYDVIVQMDAGLTHNPYDIVPMLETLELNNYDLVIGSRRITKQPLWHFRTFLSLAAVHLMRLIDINFEDVTSGFRIWRSDLLSRINWNFISAHGFGFQLQMLYSAVSLQANIAEYQIPYKLTNSSLNSRMIGEAIKIWGNLFIVTKRSESSFLTP